jgi:hypothetical protein
MTTPSAHAGVATSVPSLTHPHVRSLGYSVAPSHEHDGAAITVTTT